MIPVIALVGRPNVGKSTLFNCLTRSRDAIVADMPGVTRDRQYGHGRIGEKPFLIVDTGGIGYLEKDIDTPMAEQTKEAIGEADFVFFMLDAKAGVTPADRETAKIVRQSSKPVILVVNKSDGVNVTTDSAEFYQLGFDQPCFISAAHNRGIKELIVNALASLPESEDEVSKLNPKAIKVAVVGRPNVGKSTLINRLLGEERVVVFDQPGTTRDSIFIPFNYQDQDYVLIDTAGVRRRSRIDEALEKFSVLKTLKAIEQSNVVIFVINSRERIGEQDLRLLAHVIDSGRSLIVAYNQWDGLESSQRQFIKTEIDRRLGYVDFAEQFFISALHGTGVGLLLGAVRKAFRAATQELGSSQLTALLETALDECQPPMSRGRRIKLRFAHPCGDNPPTIKIHGNQTGKLPDSYKRYLSNFYRKRLKMVGTPIQVLFADSDNPFKDRRNKLTPRQELQKRRMMKHVKKKKKK